MPDASANGPRVRVIEEPKMLLRAIALVAVASLVSFHATPTGAGTPDPTLSTVPPQVHVVGAQTAAGGVPDPNAPFTVIVRDNSGALLPGVQVVLDFTGCSDTHLCTVVVAGQTLDCVGHTVTGTTGTNGDVTFQVMGASHDPGTFVAVGDPPSAGAGLGCVQVYAMPGSILLGAATAVIFDLNGSIPGGNGMNGLDLSIAVLTKGQYFFCLSNFPQSVCFRGRCDYLNDNDINGGDLAVMKDLVGNSGLGVGSGAGCASGSALQPYCP